MTIATPVHDFAVEPVSPNITTAAAAADSLASDFARRDIHKALWEKMIDEKLVEWGRSPERLEEDDLVPPTPKALQLAADLAMYMRDQGLPPPTRLVPDRDGGIALERCEGNRTITFIVSSTGSVEILHWHGTRIVSADHLG